MKKILIGFTLGMVVVLSLGWFYGATNFDRIVLGSANYETDPNTSADLTFQNDEYIDNSVNGTLDFGAAALTTTGALSVGSVSGSLDVGSSVAYIDTFSTTATTDTHTVSGALPTDMFVASQRGIADTIAALQVKADTNKVIVSRTAAGAENNAAYVVIRLK